MAKGFRLKGIKQVRKPDGRRYVYRRVKGRLIPLPDLPENDPAFLEAYLDDENAITLDGTLGALIGDFMASNDFKSRKVTTQTVWRRRLKHIQNQYGKSPVSKLTKTHVQKALNKLTPGAARSERTIWRALMAYAVLMGWRDDNPAKDVDIQKSKTTPHATRTKEDVATFRKIWTIGTPERQAFEVIFWTGARCVDAVKIGWQNVENGVLEFVQEKTGGLAYVPITAPVASFLEKDRTLFLRSASPEMLFILTSAGKARSVKALSMFVSRAARDAELTNKTAHGLRKARAVILAENGWTPHQIGAWTGHESLQEIAHYTRDANKWAMVVETQTGNSRQPQSKVIDLKGK
ncbi:tyrosine-type recombinase/integrase [Tropicibacter sp. R15_0]|uniref:tyrosine-type recombinase/integrase n=1 Tax=Tropicibacter sp. R15_0 TaxID=2821101 RepID=UPI001ADD057E|nr:tyrosine-type recombinase/integrase [Tropicibacter sp. R15_0]MBO9466003.1 tyrosine-type recombinase/integrase [Tropicibacter sp. R15_0]